MPLPSLALLLLLLHHKHCPPPFLLQLEVPCGLTTCCDWLVAGKVKVPDQLAKENFVLVLRYFLILDDY